MMHLKISDKDYETLMSSYEDADRIRLEKAVKDISLSLWNLFNLDSDPNTMRMSLNKCFEELFNDGYLVVDVVEALSIIFVSWAYGDKLMKFLTPLERESVLENLLIKAKRTSS